ncbi:MAG: hypothetical protein SGJ00_01225 [bacterium]|nr:hypothetical protein [bacterium]
MRLYILAILMFIFCVSKAQTFVVATLEGIKLKDVVIYLDSNRFLYSKETNDKTKDVLIRGLLSQKYSKDSAHITNEILMLKFNKDQVCYVSKNIFETNPNQSYHKVSKQFKISNLLVSAGNGGMAANLTTLFGAGILFGGLGSNNPELILAGSLVSFTGILMNVYAWHKVKKAGELMRGMK